MPFSIALYGLLVYRKLTHLNSKASVTLSLILSLSLIVSVTLMLT